MRKGAGKTTTVRILATGPGRVGGPGRPAGRPPGERVAVALAELARAGVIVSEFALGQPSPDEVFLALTGPVGGAATGSAREAVFVTGTTTVPAAQPATALLKIRHVPEQLGDVIGIPIIFTLMFTYLFGGALDGPTCRYLQLILPGTTAMAAVLVSMYAGIGLNSDTSKGISDRFRSLPVARPAPLAGALLGDVARYLLAAGLVIGIGVAMGFRPAGGAPGVLAGVGLLLVFALSLSCVWTALGLVMRSPQAVMSVGSVVLLPLTLASNVFVRTQTMPGWLQAFVRVNPVSHLVAAQRSLMQGQPATGQVAWVLLAAAVLAAVFAPLTVYLYGRQRPARCRAPAGAVSGAARPRAASPRRSGPAMDGITAPDTLSAMSRKRALRRWHRAVAAGLVHRAWLAAQRAGTITAQTRAGRAFAEFGEHSLMAFPTGSLFGEKWIAIGDETMLGEQVSLSAGLVPGHDLGDQPVLRVGDRCVIGRGSHIVAHHSIVIGDDVFTGPYVYITDQNHGYADPDVPIGRQWPVNAAVTIGTGSWLGAGAVVLPGACVGSNVVVAAGSVVRGRVPDRCVVAGVPAKIVRNYVEETGWSRPEGSAG